MFTRSDVRTRVTRFVKDASGILEAEDIGDCIDAAIDYHSRVKRNIVVQELTGTGDRVYLTSLLSKWETGYSDGDYKIEFPVNSEAAWPTYLPANMLSIYNTPDGSAIRFMETLRSNRTPQNNDVFRVHFQIRWQITDYKPENTGKPLTTVPDADFWPICYLTAHGAFLMLSAKLAHNVDSTLSADGANYRDKDDKFAKLAKGALDRYKMAILPAPDELRAAGMEGTFEQDDFNRTSYPFFWRDESDLKNTDR